MSGGNTNMKSEILNIREKFLSKKASVSEITKEHLDRAKKSDLNAFITISEDKAIADANKAQKVIDNSGSNSPLLTGIPIGIKDLIVTKNVRTTAGSKILENYIPPYDATVVEKLQNENSVLIGKLNQDEFGMGSSNENSAYGRVLHPTFKEYVPGGSSGGSAASVKAHLCAATLGTDTGGSIRQPAAYCGIVGMKPTYGRVSRFGLISYASSLDSIGPMANTVADTAIMMDAIAGFDKYDSTSAQIESGNFYKSLSERSDLKGLKIGIPEEWFAQGGLQSEISKEIQEAINMCKKNGAEIVNVSLPHSKYSIACYYIVAVSEASSNLARFDGVRYGARFEGETLLDMYEQTRGLFGAEVKRRIILGTFALSSGYYDAYYKKACQVRRLIRDDFTKAYQACDVILAPVTPKTAFKVGEKINDPLQMYLEDIFTIPVNMAGLPSLAIPHGEDNKKLPIGIQLIGKHFDEKTLFQVGGLIEKWRNN